MTERRYLRGLSFEDRRYLRDLLTTKRPWTREQAEDALTPVLAIFRGRGIRNVDDFLNAGSVIVPVDVLLNLTCALESHYPDIWRYAPPGEKQPA